jgi:hypothetical protein
MNFSDDETNVHRVSENPSDVENVFLECGVRKGERQFKKIKNNTGTLF